MFPVITIKPIPPHIPEDDESIIQEEVHITGLEKFMKCHYMARFSPAPTPKNIEIFYEGDVSEQLLTTYLYGEKLGDEVLRYFGNSKEFEYYNRLKGHATNLKTLLKTGDRENRYPLFTQKKMRIKIICYPYIIWLVGTADWIFNDLHIADCKTSANKRQEKELDFKLQWRLYPLMLKKVSGHPYLAKDEFDFTYFIFTKQVTPQLQVLKAKGRYEDAEMLLKYLIDEYIKCLVSGERKPKKCLDCKRCPLRLKCPIRKDTEEERF